MKIENQVWKAVVGYEGRYEISFFGNVRSIRRSGAKGGQLSTATSKGYTRVGLYGTGKVKNISVHRLVAMAFVPNPNSLPLVNHLDGDKANNRADNLEWCDHKINALHATRILGKGCGESNGRAVLTQREVHLIRFLKLHHSEIKAKTVAEFFGVSDTAICDIFNFKNWNNETGKQIPDQRTM